MPYYKSLALRNFIEETKFILQTAREASLKKTGLSYNVLDMILQAAIFKTSAQLEEYTKNSINDWLYTAQRKNCVAGSLPDELKWYCISNAHFGAYKSFINNSNEARLFKSLKSKKENCLLENDRPILNLITPNAIFGDSKYPSIKNIKKLFFRLGIKKIFDEVNKRTHRSYEPLIKSFLDVREAIAHQNPPNLTYNDIKNHITNIQGFVVALDRILFSHVVSYHGIECWRLN